ncbi:MAG: TolC family protein [Spirochaetaceae bacterium]|nr:MAG: TolC family protein [Spirochaetaceae bacterium]
MRQLAAVVVLLLMMIGTAGGESYRFTLEEAIAYGLAKSTTIQSKKLAVAVAQTDLAAAKAGYYPSLSAGAGWTHLFEQSGPPYFSGSDTVGVSLEVGQSVYTFGKLKNGVKLAEEGLAQAVLDLEEEARKTIVLIKNAFYAYLLALDVQAINQGTLESKEEALEVARQRYDAGLVADFEVLKAESDLESFKATVISADNGVAIALLNVKNVLGIEEEGFEFELVGGLEPIAVQIDREALIQKALSGKYDLQSFRKRMDITAAQEKLNRSFRLPTLVGWARFSVQSGFDAITGENDYSFDAWGFGPEAFSMGLNLSVPISGFFPWSGENAAVKKSQIQSEDLRLQYDALQASIRIAVESSILKIAEERAKIASGRKSVELAQKLYDSAVEQYEGGYISSVELKDAQLGLNAARLAQSQAIYNYNRNILDLMEVVGVADF